MRNFTAITPAAPGTSSRLPSASSSARVATFRTGAPTPASGVTSARRAAKADTSDALPRFAAKPRIPSPVAASSGTAAKPRALGAAAAKLDAPGITARAAAARLDVGGGKRAAAARLDVGGRDAAGRVEAGEADEDGRLVVGMKGG